MIKEINIETAYAKADIDILGLTKGDTLIKSENGFYNIKKELIDFERYYFLFNPSYFIIANEEYYNIIVSEEYLKPYIEDNKIVLINTNVTDED